MVVRTAVPAPSALPRLRRVQCTRSGRDRLQRSLSATSPLSAPGTAHRWVEVWRSASRRVRSRQETRRTGCRALTPNGKQPRKVAVIRARSREMGSGLQNSILAEQSHTTRLAPNSAKIEFCKPDPSIETVTSSTTRKSAEIPFGASCGLLPRRPRRTRASVAPPVPANWPILGVTFRSHDEEPQGPLHGHCGFSRSSIVAWETPAR